MQGTPQSRFARYLRLAAAKNRRGAVATLQRTAERLGASQRATRALLNPLRKRHRRALLAAVERLTGIPVPAWRR